MRNKSRPGKIIGLILAASLLTGMANIEPVEIKAADEYWPEGPTINSPSAVVMECNTGVVLYEKNSHDVNYPASITKVLTTYLAIENSDPDEIVTFSKEAVENNEGDTSHISRDYDEQMTMEQCLYAVMLESANECAYAVAEHVGKAKGGDYRTFVDMMNEKAKELGCTDTHFNNANGLPDSDHWTSAYDMGLISCAAYRNEEFRKITGTETYVIPPTNKHSDNTYLNNHHDILHYHNTAKYINPYCTGGKTGYTTVANSTLVTFAEKDGLALCVVIMNANSPDHLVDTNTLIDYCFNNFKAFSISENEKSVADSQDKDLGILNDNGMFAKLDGSAYIVLPNMAEFSDAKSELKSSSDNAKIAAIQYSYAGHDVGSVDIVKAGVSVDDTYFSKTKADTDKKVVKIKLWYIIAAVLALAALVVIIILIKKFFDNIYVFRHNLSVRKEQRQKYKTAKVNRRRRRKNELSFREDKRYKRR